ncbi:hypothetical protein RFI_04476 [Reticulomyxa filosa]|uniref:Heat shock protein 70 n=1 Tax=Reticulomyxa filosa TaxID=46433 RepID=X6P337_RETFI|nr:hypothetical protein RFI_04476 [Reticulomyxa filosa]|eukprot:ETO32641.1 hypothetical protein RFI_04476 [Reticulomyxa filosa]
MLSWLFSLYQGEDEKKSEPLFVFVCLVCCCTSGTKLTPLSSKKKKALQKIDEKFDCTIAIDFGTEGTAMGINIKAAENVRLITNWNRNGINDMKETKGKTKTALLLDENHNVIAFGNEAWDKFFSKFNFDNSLQTISDLLFIFVCILILKNRYHDSDTNPKLLLFHKFKMHLYDTASQYKKKSQSNLKTALQSINGVNVEPQIVFTSALEYCKRKAMQYLEQNNLIVDENKIQWVITVPAIWSEEAKGLMKQWAQQAKLWSPSIPDQLSIVLEPECASVCMMLEMKDNQSGIRFKKGDCYMMMDLGAGTADMVCHEITGPFQVREMIASFGGSWGGSYINKDIEAIFSQIFGEETMKKFQMACSKDYVQLLDNIEKSKQRFFANKKTTGAHRIEIPYEFDKFIQENIIGELEELVAKFEYLGESGFATFLCFHTCCFKRTW